MKLYTAEVYDLLYDLLNTSAVKAQLSAVNVLLGSQRYQPGNDHDARAFLGQLNAVIITDGPAGDRVEAYGQTNSRHRYFARVILLHKMLKTENALEKMSTDISYISNVLAGQRNISLDSNKARVREILVGPEFKAYDTEASSVFKDYGYDVAVGWLDVQIEVQASN